MSKADEPAFPFQYLLNEKPVVHPGLTKRELFAAMAMQAIVGRSNLAEDGEDWLKKGGYITLADAVAHQSVVAADALIAELEKPNAP